MRLYNRDYRSITQEEKAKYEEIKATEITGVPLGTINHYCDYPEAVKHYLSYFPNNHIFLGDVKKSCDIHLINEDFRALVHNISTTEQDILRFINHEPQAYYIIGSIFNAGGFRFGHHDSYIFPEFRLGNDYRADYLLIGKSSGGYEFIFVEFEKSKGRVTLSSGNPGQVIRSGNYQILDWKYWVDSKFSSLRLFFDTEKQNGVCLPHEFYDFDSTRMHYVVVAGTRDDYNEQTYRCRRREALDSNIVLLHYDNLYDASERLIEQNTF